MNSLTSSSDKWFTVIGLILFQQFNTDCFCCQSVILNAFVSENSVMLSVKIFVTFFSCHQEGDYHPPLPSQPPPDEPDGRITSPMEHSVEIMQVRILPDAVSKLFFFVSIKKILAQPSQLPIRYDVKSCIL